MTVVKFLLFVSNAFFDREHHKRKYNRQSDGSLFNRQIDNCRFVTAGPYIFQHIFTCQSDS